MIVHWFLRSSILISLYILAESRFSQTALISRALGVSPVAFLYFAGLVLVVAAIEVVSRVLTGHPTTKDLVCDLVLGVVYLFFLLRAIVQGLGHII